MTRIFFVTLMMLLLSGPAFAQGGMGSLDFTGKRQYRPELQASIRHPNGSKAWRFELPGGSCNREDCRSDRERAQLLQRRPDNLEGHSYRYFVSFFLPQNFPDVSPANLILWEVKPRGSGKPSAVIEIVDGRLQFSLSNPGVIQRDKMRPEKPLIIKSLGGIPRGRWTDIVIDVKWSRGKDGVLRVNRNGRRVVNYRGPNIDSNSKRQMVMFGIYRSFVSRYLRAKGQKQTPLQRVYFANVQRQKIRM